VGTYLSITPMASWHGRLVPLPHALLQRWLPVTDVVRGPTRLGVVALVGFSLLAGLAFAECARAIRGGGARRARRAAPLALAVVVAFAMYAEYRGWVRRLGGPHPTPVVYPLRLAETPSALVAAAPSAAGTLVELPLLGTDGLFPLPHARAMYRSIGGWRPLLNGYSSYWPAGFRERMALVQRLPDPAAIDVLRRDAGLGLVLMHTEELAADDRRTWEALAAGDGGHSMHLLGREGADLLFEITPP
jgi:hypothetical protein